MKVWIKYPRKVQLITQFTHQSSTSLNSFLRFQLLPRKNEVVSNDKLVLPAVKSLLSIR